LPQVTVDFAAAGRVAKRAELKSIRVIEVSAKCDPKTAAPLEPTVNLECIVANQDANALEIVCNCHFAAHTIQAQVAEATIKYLIVYEIQGTEPLASGDVAEFASSNGTLNAWPFLRELLYGLTSKMGYPAYVLPTFHFVPKQQEKKESGEKPKPQAEPVKSEQKA
jgi:preprotein translocase subunit SecB